MDDELIQQRKGDHLRIVTQEDVTHSRTTLLECVELAHNALPELSLDEISTSTTLMGKELGAPLMITSMTGGEKAGARLNRELAEVAGRYGIAFAVGSQRVMLRHPDRQADFAVRKEIGEDGLLFGNIGAQQLRETSTDAVKSLVETIEADGLCVHLNVGHELAQEEGDRDFTGLLAEIEYLCQALPGKVIVKETGAGLSNTVVARLINAGVTCVDVAGAGGTSWTKVESYRGKDPLAHNVADAFADWGIPTGAATLSAAHTIAGLNANTCLIASGGILTGLDVARALALGADLAGMARSVLLAWQSGGATGVDDYLARVIHQLKVACLLTGADHVTKLRSAPRVYTGELTYWLAAIDAEAGEMND